jgi:hypothetical protein
VKRLNLLGQKFARLLVIGPPVYINHRSNWPCRCDCKKELLVVGTSLVTGNTKSCGCWNLEVAREKGKLQSHKHGHSGDHSKGKKASPTYRSWTSMRSRCSNPKTTQYENYGGRGITVCDRWKGPQGFQNFLADMGERPVNKTLDRFPNKSGNYEPGNCRWSDPQEQVDNRRTYQALEKYSDEEIHTEFYKRKLNEVGEKF